MSQGKHEAALKIKPLKQIYPDIQQRKKYLQMKMQAKTNTSILVRCQPAPKCKITQASYFNIIAPTSYELAYIAGTIHKRVFASQSAQSHRSSIYLFNNGKIVTQFKQKIGTFWAQRKQNDGILYFEYADEAPF